MKPVNKNYSLSSKHLDASSNYTEKNLVKKMMQKQLKY